jgi:two-component system response regulator FixJ
LKLRAGFPSQKAYVFDPDQRTGRAGWHCCGMEKARSAPPAVRRTVYIIDKDTDVLNSFRFSLELEGYSVRAYPDGRELLASAELPKSGCLVIDNDLPPATGLDVLAQLRRRGLTIPAILTANAATPAVRARASEAGVPVVEKPLLGHALIDAIQDALA